MARIWQLIKSFGHFWYDFVIGDDWVAAAGVAVLVGGTFGLHALGVLAWWFGPVVIVATGAFTVHRALVRQATGGPAEG